MKLSNVGKLWCCIFLAFFNVAHARGQDFAKLVDPRIGTQGDGHMHCGFTYVGASYPMGMVQFTPGFFTPQRGFVINQLSGGGCAQMGNFPVIPLSGTLQMSPNDMNGYSPYDKINEAYAGYLSVDMEDGTKVDLTVNKRSGIARFLFAEGVEKGTVIIGSGVNSTFVRNSMVKITSDQSCEGFAEGGDFCGEAIGDYRVFFVAEFDRPAQEKGVWMKNRIYDSVDRAFGKNAGAYFTFNAQDNQEVNYRIAISYVSIENAKENLKASNDNCGFDDYKDKTVQVWNNTLGKIKVESPNKDRIVQFYTHFYHSLIHPNIVSDVNGEYMGADFQVHKVEKGDHYSTFSVWDTYRSQAQLLAMLYPDKSSDMMQSLVDFAEQSGGFGRWILANLETGIMQGDPTPILISNSYVFGADDFDTKTAYTYMKRGATVSHACSHQHEIRPGLSEYIKNGFNPNASVMLEYTSSDFAIGQFALKALDNREDASIFIHRSQNWKNIYNPEINWLCSRDSNGQWRDIARDWREATHADYCWMVPYNLKCLIDTIGGKEFAGKRLDTLFRRFDAAYNEDWYAAGNEPGFQIPWIYNWTNAPYKSSQVIHRILNDVYSSKPSGLPGNDDVGAMGSWYVFASVGLYPMIPGIAGFSISTPQFEKVKIEFPDGELVISGGSLDNIYIRSLKLNGRRYKSTWINWDDLKKGGEIKFTTSHKINKDWGLNEESPSYNSFK